MKSILLAASLIGVISFGNVPKIWGVHALSANSSGGEQVSSSGCANLTGMNWASCRQVKQFYQGASVIPCASYHYETDSMDSDQEDFMVTNSCGFGLNFEVVDMANPDPGVDMAAGEVGGGATVKTLLSKVAAEKQRAFMARWAVCPTPYVVAYYESGSDSYVLSETDLAAGTPWYCVILNPVPD